MFRSLPLPCFPAWASPDRGFAPEWKVTRRGVVWGTSERFDQCAEVSIKDDKKQYSQQFAAQSSRALPRAEGATKPPKVTQFHTALSVIHFQKFMGCKGGNPCPPEVASIPAGGIFNLFSFLPVKPKP